MSAAIRPFEPPLCTADLDAPGGVVEAVPEHFVVDEIPLYPPDGEGSHWFFRFRKRRMTTQEAVRRIARASGVERRTIGVAGQKDKHAVTTQWASVPGDAPSPDTWEDLGDIEILEVHRHRKRLKRGHVRGNRFALTFTGLEGQWQLRFDAVVERIRRDGLPNAFGPQRFGTGQRNLEEALAWARGEVTLKGMHARFKARLLPSVLQSEVFNRYLSRRLADPVPLYAGEVVRLDGSNSVFVVEDADRELPRLESGDIHRTGPMFGPRCRRTTGVVDEWEREAVAALGLSRDDLKRVAKAAPGARRDLLVMPEDLAYRSTSEREAVLSFALPSGAYATQLAREFTRLSWASPLRPPEPEPEEPT